MIIFIIVGTALLILLSILSYTNFSGQSGKAIAFDPDTTLLGKEKPAYDEMPSDSAKADSIDKAEKEEAKRLAELEKEQQRQMRELEKQAEAAERARQKEIERQRIAAEREAERRRRERDKLFNRVAGTVLTTASRNILGSLKKGR